MRTETLNIHGIPERYRVFDLPVVDPMNYWSSVTDVPCPLPRCSGIIRWYEAGYVPGYRICDTCKRHFLAKGTSNEPYLVQLKERSRHVKGGGLFYPG